MNEITSSKLKDKVHDLKHEPTRVMGLTLDLLERSLIDQEAFIVDPSQPLPFLIENDVVLTHAAVEAFEANTMRMYPVLAQTEADLFLHMNDTDLVGMFAVPGESEFVFMFSKAELLANVVSIPGTFSKKITIPKHTQILVNGLYFTMQYAITILIKPHGGMEISYDGSDSSAIQKLSGTRVDWDILKLPSDMVGNLPNEYVRITTPIKQMRLTSHKATSSPVTLFKKTYGLTDQFCHADVFMETNNGLTRINTTHSDHTFDPYKTTMQLKVIGNTLTVELPYVYQATNAASATFRIDIYTTKGGVYMDLSGISGGFEAKFLDLDKTDKGRYHAPMSKLDSVAVLSTGAVDGGTNVPSFKVRRDKILNNTIGEPSKPITPSQLENTVNTLGFDIVLNHDDALGRTYQVSRSMAKHELGLSDSPIDSATMTARSSIEALVSLDTVRDNYEQVTILPDTLYKDVGGVLVIVTDEERVAIGDMKGDLLANQLTYNRYLTTPFHYVLDFDNNKVDARPYYLSNPTMDVAGFSASNESIDIFVQSSSDTFIEHSDDGYLITAVTESNDAYKALDDSQTVVQLAFQPDIESEWVYVNGTMLTVTDTGERIFQFHIATDWVVRANHQLALTNFTMRLNESQLHDTPLEGEWYLIWGANDYFVEGMVPSPVDEMLGHHLLSDTVTGIYRESVTITLGHELSGMWRRSRPMTGTVAYKTHPIDVYKHHDRNVYELDVDGSPVVETVNGKKRLKLLHAKGDPVLDSNGDQLVLYYKGQMLKDEYDEPIPENARQVVYWWDVVLFDAQYRYATRALDADYFQSVAITMVEWVNETLKPIREMTEPRTEFRFHPRNSLRFINVLADDGRRESIYTAQRLVVDVYLDDQTFKEGELRETLTFAVQQVVQSVISKTRVSREDLVSALLKRLGDDVMTVKVSGLGGGNYEIITLEDPTTRLCIAKTLSVESDGTLSINDDITVNYLRHGM